MMLQVDPFPKRNQLPVTLPEDGTINMALENGVPIFRASTVVQTRIEQLLVRQQVRPLTAVEEEELDRYEEIDDYLSHLNRLVRNLVETQ